MGCLRQYGMPEVRACCDEWGAFGCIPPMQYPSCSSNRRPSSLQLTIPPVDGKTARRMAQAAAPDTSGKSWFDMPATKITEEVKRDLRMLRLR